MQFRNYVVLEDNAERTVSAALIHRVRVLAVSGEEPQGLQLQVLAQERGLDPIPRDVSGLPEQFRYPQDGH